MIHKKYKENQRNGKEKARNGRTEKKEHEIMKIQEKEYKNTTISPVSASACSFYNS